MKKAIALLASFAAMACGEAIDADGIALDVPEEDLGTLRQPIYMPSGYGSEEGDQTRCDSSWSGGGCMIPDNRSPGFAIQSSCLQGTLFHDQAYLALGYVMGVVNSSPLSWAMDRYHSGSADWHINCVGSGSLANTSCSILPAPDCHDTPRGELCQCKGGNIDINVNAVQNSPGWVNGTTAQRGRFINNIVRHEVGHAIGLGHVPSSAGKLMSVGYPSEPVPGVDPWDNLYTFDSTEVNALDCYRETSGTTPRC
jgi:hypothetical protein